MHNIISDFTKQLWRSNRRTKEKPDGWISGNAVCCQHRGERADTKGRGGLIINQTGVATYSCFNCSFKASFQPGYHLSFKFRKLLQWMGASDVDINRLVLEALRLKEYIGETQPELVVKEKVCFVPVALPPGAKTFNEILQANTDEVLPIDFVAGVKYVHNRNIDLGVYTFYWAPSRRNNMLHRVIVPYYWENQLVGYTARAVDDTITPKYFNQVDSHFVFNVTAQTKERKFVIVCEGVFDAMSIDGVAVMHNTLSEQQVDIIDALGKEVIVVPDNDDGPGATLIQHAIDCQWAVSFPIWFDDPDCKDVNDAVCKYGKLFVLKSIIEGKEVSKLRIEIKKKRLYKQ